MFIRLRKIRVIILNRKYNFYPVEIKKICTQVMILIVVDGGPVSTFITFVCTMHLASHNNNYNQLQHESLCSRKQSLVIQVTTGLIKLGLLHLHFLRSTQIMYTESG